MLPSQHSAPVPSQLGAIHGQDEFQIRQVGPHIHDLGKLRFRRHHDSLRPGIAQDIFDVRFEQGGVDRHGDGAQAQQRVVGQRPLHTIFGENGHAVAALDVQAAQQRGQRRHLAQSLLRRNALVSPFALEQETVRLGVLGDRLQEQFVEGFDFAQAHIIC